MFIVYRILNVFPICRLSILELAQNLRKLWFLVNFALFLQSLKLAHTWKSRGVLKVAKTKRQKAFFQSF